MNDANYIYPAILSEIILKNSDAGGRLDNIAIGQIMKAARYYKNLTQEQVADKLFVTPDCVQKYESGKNKIPSDKILELSQILGLSCKTLLGKGLTENEYFEIAKATAVINIINSCRLSVG